MEDSPGMEKRTEVPSTNLLEGAPKTEAFSWLVRKVVRAMAKMLMTTPLMTWSALNRTHSTAWIME